MKKLVLLFFVLALVSCSNSNFNKRVVIPEAEWPQENRVAFDVNIDDTISGYAYG